MRLTDATNIRRLNNGIVAVFEGTGPAKLVRPENTWPCSWVVPVATEDGMRGQGCGHATVEFDNGFMCVAGHDHYTYGTYEYYDAEEFEGARKAGVLPANARKMGAE